MKHFFGTPIGGTRVASLAFARGRMLLIPWKRPDSLAVAMSHSRGFCVDNSAFSFWRTGEVPDWGKYIKWCKTFARHPRFEFAIIPDVIGGDAKENNELIAMWDRSCWKTPFIRGVPVYHLHEDISRIDRLRRYDMICIGSSGQWPNPGVGEWWDRMDEVFTYLCDSDGYPRLRVHGLRMLRRSIVERYPFYSCDSTSAAQNGKREAAKHGIACAAFGQAILADKVEHTQSPGQFTQASSNRLQLFEKGMTCT